MGFLNLERKLKFADHVDGYRPDQLFDYGRNASLVPRPPGFSLYVPGNTFNPGVDVRIELKSEALRLDIGFEGKVDSCSLESGIAVSGLAKPLGHAEMWLKMNPSELNGTDLDYGIVLTAANMSMLPIVMTAQGLLKVSAARFADQYRNNVIQAIESA